jgi:hypothetical protein
MNTPDEPSRRKEDSGTNEKKRKKSSDPKKSSSDKNDGKGGACSLLTFILPGLVHPIDIPFPDKKLPVCSRCKAIYKTRQLCRIRDGHKTVPWCTTYICFILDDSCITQDSQGNDVLVQEGPYRFKAEHIPEPTTSYRVKRGYLAGTQNGSPICVNCKTKNYTRENCREKQRHNRLPWVTVYVSLTAVPCSDQEKELPLLSNNVNSIAAPRYNFAFTPSLKDNQQEVTEVQIQPSRFSTPYVLNPIDARKAPENSIHKIEPSKAFLLTIFKEYTSELTWLEIGPENSSSLHVTDELANPLFSYQKHPHLTALSQPLPSTMSAPYYTATLESNTASTALTAQSGAHDQPRADRFQTNSLYDFTARSEPTPSTIRLLNQQQVDDYNRLNMMNMYHRQQGLLRYNIQPQNFTAPYASSMHPQQHYGQQAGVQDSLGNAHFVNMNVLRQMGNPATQGHPHHVMPFNRNSVATISHLSYPSNNTFDHNQHDGSESYPFLPHQVPSHVYSSTYHPSPNQNNQNGGYYTEQNDRMAPDEGGMNDRSFFQG